MLFMLFRICIKFDAGPNELSFADADLLPSLFATDMPRGPCTSLALYNNLLLMDRHKLVWDGRRNPDTAPHLISTRSSTDHARKRTPWTHAFSSANIREYEPAIARRVTQLMEELEKRAINGRGVDLAEWMSFFSWVPLFV